MQRIARFMRLGQLPEKIRNQLNAEGGVRYLDEGVPITAILQGFRAPGLFCGYRSMSFAGYLAISEQRIVVHASFYNEASVNVRFDDPWLREIHFRRVRNHLELAFNAEKVIPRASGEVCLRIRVTDVAQVAELLRAKGAVVSGERASPSAPPDAVASCHPSSTSAYPRPKYHPAIGRVLMVVARSTCRPDELRESGGRGSAAPGLSRPRTQRPGDCLPGRRSGPKRPGGRWCRTGRRIPTRTSPCRTWDRAGSEPGVGGSGSLGDRRVPGRHYLRSRLARPRLPQPNR